MFRTHPKYPFLTLQINMLFLNLMAVTPERGNDKQTLRTIITWYINNFMRLTTEQIALIKQNTALIFGDEAKIYLFGSRTDDNAKGGDIDLFIELANETEKPV